MVRGSTNDPKNSDSQRLSMCRERCRVRGHLHLRRPGRAHGELGLQSDKSGRVESFAGTRGHNFIYAGAARGARGAQSSGVSARGRPRHTDLMEGALVTGLRKRLGRLDERDLARNNADLPVETVVVGCSTNVFSRGRIQGGSALSHGRGNLFRSPGNRFCEKKPDAKLLKDGVRRATPRTDDALIRKVQVVR